MELWDAYDSKFNKIDNLTLVREKDKIPNGVYHLVCDIGVRHVDGSYLIMQRSTNKTFGGMWEFTSGGSALKGESPIECAKRELFEETGIVCNELVEIGRDICEERHSIYVEFLCVTGQDKNNIILQEGETQDYKWVSKEELLSLKEDKLVTKRMQKFLKELN